MPFCIKCGKEIISGSNYCPVCGASQAGNTHSNQRSTVFEGELHKCPNCGEILDSFMSRCPTCDYEIRGAESARAVSEFSVRLEKLRFESDKINFIRNFPIPNSKEDIYEFMILSSTNIGEEIDSELSKAWAVKMEQCYQKAHMVFTNQAEFEYIQNCYNECHRKMKAVRIRNTGKTIFQIVIKNIIVVIGIAFVLAGVIVDSSGGNSILFEIIGYIIFLLSAVTLKNRNCQISDYLIGIFSGIASIGASLFIFYTEWGFLSGIAIIFAVIVNYIQKMSNNAKTSKRRKVISTKSNIDKVKVPLAVICGIYRDCNVVRSLFIQAGFKYVSTVPLKDLPYDESEEDGKIASIRINGRSLSMYFRRTFDADADVLLLYHSINYHI